MPPDKTDPDRILIMPFAMGAGFNQEPSRLNHPVKRRVVGFSMFRDTVRDHIMIPATFPATGPVPLVNQILVTEIRVGAMNNDLFDIA